MNAAEQTSDNLVVPASLSYPAARLRLGIIYVGVLVAAAVGLLVADLDDNLLLRTLDARFGVFISLGLLVGMATLLSFPFDLIGGHLLPKAFGRDAVSLSRTVLGLLRGAFNHAGLLWMIGSAYLVAAQVGGWAFVPVAAVGFMVLLVGAQTTVAQFVGGVCESSTAPTEARVLPITFMASKEASFSGAIVGWPGADRIVIAEGWRERLHPRLYELFVGRRIAAVELGLRRRGVVVAILWNLTGISGAAYLSGISGTAVAELIDFVCITTLWSFIGLLTLPSCSRRAVTAVDQHMLAVGYSRDDLTELARITGGWQDGEASRSPVIETIFHPQPSTENRTAAFDRRAPRWAAWNLARMTLYLSWASLGLLSRSVHSNAGRPDLWAMGAVD